MFRAPDAYGYFTATLKPHTGWTAWVSGTCTGKMPVQHLKGVIDRDVAVITPAFFDMEIKAAYDFKIYKEMVLQLNAGVKNLFDAFQSDLDRGPDRDPAYVYGPSLPRSYFAGVKFSF